MERAEFPLASDRILSLLGRLAGHLGNHRAIGVDFRVDLFNPSQDGIDDLHWR
jgi:hypothetical protein